MKLRIPYLLSLAALLSTAVASAEAPRPNIIFILTDDLGYGDYGVFFQNSRRDKGDRSEPWHVTPRLDSMAAEGVQLRHHYCPAPVCAPSRASLLLGVHQGHANVRDNQFDKALANNHTLGTVLRGAGYATAVIGKWGLQGGREGNDAKEKAGPAAWAGYPTKRGFDFFHGYVRHKDGHGQYPNEDGKEVWENEREISADLAGSYTTDLFTARAKHWITNQREKHPQQPFFLYLAYATPHAKLQLPPGEYPAGDGAKGGVQWLGKPGQAINTADGKPDSYVHPDYARATWDHDRDPATAEQPWPDVYQRYATVVRRIDDCVGDLLQLLKDLAIDDNTLVIFTTDNGPSKESYLPENYEPDFFKSFGPFDGIKRDVLEGGIRVGALARWPGGAPGKRVSTAPSQFHDWMPTFAELAGVASPAVTDGISLVPTITGQGTQKPSQVYVEYMNNQKTPNYRDFAPANRGRVRQQMQAIREGDFIGVRYNIKSHEDPFEIYEVEADPQQTKNLASAKPELQQQLRDRVLRMRRPEASAKRPYDAELVPAVSGTELNPGVMWRAYAKGTPWLGRLEDMAPTASGTSAQIAKSGTADSAALLFSGYIEVPENGAYTFSVPEGATALLRVHEATVIDRAFDPAPGDFTGTALLQAGRHPFRLYWQSAEGAPQLEVSGPSLPKEVVSASRLFHE